MTVSKSSGVVVIAGPCRASPALLTRMSNGSCAGNGSSGLFNVSDIQGQSGGFPAFRAEGYHQVAQFAFRPGGQSDPGTCFCQRDRRGETDARRGAGHQGTFAIERERWCLG